MTNPARKTGGAAGGKKKWIIAGGIVLALAAAGVFAVFMQPDEEIQYTLKAINGTKEVQEHEGHVKEVKWVPDRGRGGGRGFEADVLGNDGSLIGQVRGFRVEGLGTSVRRSRWKENGDDLTAEWPQDFRRGRGPRPGGNDQPPPPPPPEQH